MGDNDTAIGGPRRSFPSTIWSAILEAGDRSSDRSREQLDRLLRAYWKPVFAYVRSSWRKPVEDAKDLTQAFFAYLLQKDTLARMDPGRGSFRGYLKRALKHFLIDAERRDAVRRAVHPGFSIEAAAADLERISSPDEDPERAYDREWFRSVLSDSIDELESAMKAEAKPHYFEVFRTYCLPAGTGRPAPTGDGSDGPTYAEVGARLGVAESDVRTYLTYCRGALRQILRRRVREYVADDGDVDGELKEVLDG